MARMNLSEFAQKQVIEFAELAKTDESYRPILEAWESRLKCLKDRESK